MRILTLAIMAAIFGGLAFAADSTECLKLTGAGDVDRDGFCAGFDSAANPDMSVDCDDSDASISPEGTEVYNDGIDQDCSGKDAELSVEGATLARWQSGSDYKGRRWSDASFEAERKRCQDAADECSVDDNHGEYDLSEGFVFVDLVVGTPPDQISVGSVRFGQDRIREVVSAQTWESYRHLRGRSGGLSSAAVDKKLAKAQEEQAVVDAQQNAAVAATQAEVDVIEQNVGSLVGVVETNVEHIGVLVSDAIQTKTDLGELSEELGGLTASVERLEPEVQANSGSAALVEGTFSVGTSVGSRAVSAGGNALRNPSALGAGMGLTFGGVTPSGRGAIFVEGLFGGDGGAGPASSWIVGMEGLKQMSDDKYTGAFGGYAERYSNSDFLNSKVVGRQALAGLSFAKVLSRSEARHTVFQLRAGVGPEFIGVGGRSRVDMNDGRIESSGVSEYVSAAFRLSLGIGGGIGKRS